MYVACVNVHKMQLHCRGFFFNRERGRARERGNKLNQLKSEGRSLPMKKLSQ